MSEETTDQKAAVEVTPEMDQFIQWVENMTVLELSKLVKALEERLGVTAAAPMAAMPMGMMGGAGAVEAEAEKDSFDVVLVSAGEKKIQVIKEVRVITSLGLKEAKELVDGAPKTVKEGVTKEEAEELKNKLESAGAVIEIK
ncbi:MAG: 50S ribosomal protein L7/L12 [Verrucomicrobiota bacterium]|jgi:large subunit ribosomal protein L7/L12|nr:50S ribosomal protein L7/L12 [Verrucomicrobiota bacterium]MDD8049794.1 50S ribosomal protein L7/L12 [Verrucomicrobiota bacterium]MDI9384070.1 50S ribosomal protein L7/L12 [Verrucomicrobiota bacterium]